MRAKDVAFVADVLANEARHAAPGEVPGLLAATGALRVAIIERQPYDADVTALEAVEDALAGRLYAPRATESGEQTAPVPGCQPGRERGADAESASEDADG